MSEGYTDDNDDEMSFGAPLASAGHSRTTAAAAATDEENVFEYDGAGSSQQQPTNRSVSSSSSAAKYEGLNNRTTNAPAAPSNIENPFDAPISEESIAVAEENSLATSSSLPLDASAATSSTSNLAHLTSESWADMFWATATWKQRAQQFCYAHSIMLSLATQLVMIFLFLIIEPTAIKKDISFSPVMAFFLILCELVQLLIIVLAHLGMARELTALYVRPGKIWNMYMSTVMSFSALYFTFFCFQRSSFQVDGYAPDGKDDTDPNNDNSEKPYEDLQTANDIPTIFIYFMYFSGAIMTSTGFGDIAPTLWYSQIMTNGQMLLGTMYHVGVFGLTLSHFRTFQKVNESQEAADLAAGRVSRVRRVWNWLNSYAWVQRIRSHRHTATAKRLGIKYLVLVCIVFQTLNTMLLLTIPDPFRALTSKDDGYNAKIIVLTIVTLFQTAMFIGVMYISIRLVKQINNANITPGFLIQSFLATALLFGGIYFVLFAATPNHQFSHHSALHLSVFEVLYVFVHFSLTVMTTTGFGDVYARGVIARLFVLAQMLISILYSAVIIGLGTSQLIDMQAAKAEADFKAKEQERLDEARRRVEEEREREARENGEV